MAKPKKKGKRLSPREHERKRDLRTRRQLDRLVLGELADFALVICEGCGLEQANKQHPLGEYGFVLGCVVCGHHYARSSPNHVAALASLQLPSGLTVDDPI